MTYRPYPNPDRARHQVERHAGETPPLSEPRPMTPFEQQLFARASALATAVRPSVQAITESLHAAFAKPSPARSGEEST